MSHSACLNAFYTDHVVVGVFTSQRYIYVSEGEQEEQWLADAGLSTLISEDTETVDKTALLSTLTKTQAEAVKRRVETYTLRKRNKPPPRDVRDIFSSQVRMLKY